MPLRTVLGLTIGFRRATISEPRRSLEGSSMSPHRSSSRRLMKTPSESHLQRHCSFRQAWTDKPKSVNRCADDFFGLRRKLRFSLRDFRFWFWGSQSRPIKPPFYIFRKIFCKYFKNHSFYPSENKRTKCLEVALLKISGRKSWLTFMYPGCPCCR